MTELKSLAIGQYFPCLSQNYARKSIHKKDIEQALKNYAKMKQILTLYFHLSNDKICSMEMPWVSVFLRFANRKSNVNLY